MYKNIIILDEPNHGAPSIATTAAIARTHPSSGDRNNTAEVDPPTPPLNPPPPSNANSTNTTTNSGNTASSTSTANGSNSTTSTSSNGSKKKELTHMLSEVEAHAQRVGYTVSTV